ncbi:hypothetical protein [Lacinutrix algicola]|uniref:hypothetical protein n=1 Tax=Lacinutrix algicola TaxID=342954 RepID=UPI0006E32D6D|nr:hypothetical protein [Lacinutrix algicola]
MNFRIILLLSLISLSSYSQSKQKFENGNLTVDYQKAKKVSKTFNLNSSSKLKSESFIKISIKCKIKSLNKEDIDINKFSLVDHKNKLRYRPMDISFQPVMGYLAYPKLLKSKLKLGSMYKHQAGLAYKPEIKDSYVEYTIEGYTDVEVPFNFGTKKNPKKSVVYFRPNNFHKFKSLFFFPISKSAENPDLEFYYGKEKISKVEL